MEIPISQAPSIQPSVQMTGYEASPAAPSAPIAPAPGLQNGFFQTPAPVAPPVPVAAPAPVPSGSGRKERLDGAMDPRDLDAEIARMERELMGQPQTPPSQPTPPTAIQSNPNVNPNMDTDPAFTSAFLSPDEIRQFQQSTQDYPTQRLPMNPGNP